MAKRRIEPPPIESRVFQSPDEIDRGIGKLERRIQELAVLDIPAAVRDGTGSEDVARSNIVEAIREVFGPSSPEFHEHEHLDLWVGAVYMGMHPSEIVQAKERGRAQASGILKGLIGRLQEKREDLTRGWD
jgi:hypothetical protein